jgi:hypothetical protein
MEIFGAAASELDEAVAWMRRASSSLETAACLLDEMKRSDDLAMEMLSFAGMASQDFFGPRLIPARPIHDDDEAGGAAIRLPNVAVDIVAGHSYRFGVVEERAFGEDAMALPYSGNPEAAAADVNTAINLLRNSGPRVGGIIRDMAATVRTCPVEAAFLSLPHTTYPSRMSPHPLAIRWGAHLARFLGEGTDFEESAGELADRASLINAADYLRASSDISALQDLLDAAGTSHNLLCSINTMHRELGRMLSVLTEGIILLGGRHVLDAVLAGNAVDIHDDDDDDDE